MKLDWKHFEGMPCNWFAEGKSGFTYEIEFLMNFGFQVHLKHPSYHGRLFTHGDVTTLGFAQHICQIHEDAE